VIDKRVALVTGATRGIGHAIAVKLAEEGFAVAAVGTRTETEVQESINEIKKLGNPYIYIEGNIAKGEARKRIIEDTMRNFGRLDVLVNNAGVAPKVRTDILDMTEESMDYVLGINLKGTFFLTQLAANIMIEEINTAKDIRPKIINISSISAYTSSTQRGEYCISKAGASMVTTLFADRLAEYGINVYEIRPGVIATDMTSKVRDKYDKLIEEGLTPIKRWGYPEDVAKAVSVMCSDMLSFSTGEVINVDGGFHLRRL
jgi:3-oxoacyl-[acyl-carrier protein] reductase